MTDLLDTIETALLEIEGARTRISKIRSVQITQGDVRDYLKSVAFAWFKSHRPKLTGQLPDTTVRSVDEQLQRVLDATDKASARTTYVAAIKEAKGALTALRTEALVMPLRDEGTIEPAPDFTPLASDSTLRDILVRR